MAYIDIAFALFLEALGLVPWHGGRPRYPLVLQEHQEVATSPRLGAAPPLVPHSQFRSPSLPSTFLPHSLLSLSLPYSTIPWIIFALLSPLTCKRDEIFSLSQVLFGFDYSYIHGLPSSSSAHAFCWRTSLHSDNKCIPSSLHRSRSCVLLTPISSACSLTRGLCRKVEIFMFIAFWKASFHGNYVLLITTVLTSFLLHR